MSKKDQLREQRVGTIINKISQKEDKQCIKAVERVIEALKQEFNVNIVWQKRLYLSDIIDYLKRMFNDVEFAQPNETSFMSPDGGITFLTDKEGTSYPILIAEVKNQGTNDKRQEEGKSKQAQGNAVERLGKNVIGFRTFMLNEGIFPFVCFGDGCDFEPGSSILDRIITIAMFGKLNEDGTSNCGPNGIFNRGSYYFRKQEWTEDEMFNILLEVGRKSIYYYFSKYGDKNFR